MPSCCDSPRLIAERLAGLDRDNAEWQRDLFVSLFKIITLLLQADDSDAACRMAKQLDAQAKLMAERFPQDAQRDDYLRDAANLLARACGAGD